MQNRDDHPIRVGITHGDVNGISYEIILKTLSDSRILDMCTPIVYGSSKVASYHRKMISIEDFNFNIIKTAEQVLPKKANLVNCCEEEIKLEIGTSSNEAGRFALLALDTAVKDLKEGLIDVLITAPINKYNIQSESFDFPGHTEYLAKQFGKEDYMMMLVCDYMKVGVVTGHLPLKEVASQLTKDQILKKIKLMNESLKTDFSVLLPKIAVLGLNPHAGDNGLLGKEELEIIIPAIEEAKKQGIIAQGPFPADGFFGCSDFTKFDGIIAMYHDQGLIPFKTQCFDQGVNFTAGLPVIRTSPDHGTGYNIAGKNTASPDSFRNALYTAIDIYNNRTNNIEAQKKSMDYRPTER